MQKQAQTIDSRTGTIMKSKRDDTRSIKHVNFVLKLISKDKFTKTSR